MEELQRSVIFFTRANSQLKSKNEGLEQLLFAAKQQIESRGGGNAVAAQQQQQQPQKQSNPSPSMPVNVALQQSPSTKDDANLDRKPAALPQPLPTKQSNVPVVAPVAAPVQQPQSQAPTPTLQIQQQTLQMANWIAMAQAAQQASAAVEQQAGGMVPNPILPGLAMANMFANPQLMNMAAAASMSMAAGFLGQLATEQNQDKAISQALPAEQQQVPQLQPQQFDQAAQILPEPLVTPVDTNSDKNDVNKSLAPPLPAPCPADDTGTAEI